MKTHLLFYRISLCIILILSALPHTMAQTIADFETFGLSAGEYNDNAMDAGFIGGNVFLPNTNEGFWNGWPVSAITAVETRGFWNQYSS